MTEAEFLSMLEEALTGEIPSTEIRSNINYYHDYIQSKKSNQSEKSVIEELGDPRLIARTIIDTYHMNHPGQHFDSETYSSRSEYQEQYTQSSEDELNHSYHNFHKKAKWITWTVLIGILVIILLILSVTFWIFGVIFKVALRILLPVVLILCGIKLFQNIFRR